MWRSKWQDLDQINDFIENLITFKNLKEVRWERIDEAVQMANQPASPQEDWIIPPDENKTLKELENDPDYLRLRKRIESGIVKLNEIAKFLSFNDHHEFDWISFITPLMGNEALEDGIKVSIRLKDITEKKNYVLQNLIRLWS